MSPTPHQLLVEAVIFWSIALVIYFGRMYVLKTLIYLSHLTDLFPVLRVPSPMDPLNVYFVRH